MCELYFSYKKGDEKEMKKRLCGCVLCFIYLIFMLFCYKKNIKLKNVCFLCKMAKVFSRKIILDLITSLLNLVNLANIKTNRKINSWELTINFR